MSFQKTENLIEGQKNIDIKKNGALNPSIQLLSY